MNEPVRGRVFACPLCGSRVFSWAASGPPQRRCHGCGYVWNPMLDWTGPVLPAHVEAEPDEFWWRRVLDDVDRELLEQLEEA